MKPRTRYLLLALTLLSTLNAQFSTVFAQGTAFTYQGRLNDGANPASGLYDLRFTIYDSTNDPGVVIAGPLTNTALNVSNGIFSVALDFGPGVFTGAGRWMEIGVRTNGGSFASLAPRQPLTPAPYALFAGAASNLSGTLPAAQLSGTVGNGQLANNSVTVSAGSGLGGGGTVALGGATTLSNNGVLSVTGNADILASTLGGAVTLSTSATNANVASRIVKRDASGNFSAASITLSGYLNLGSTTATGGVIRVNGTNLVHSFGFENFFAGLGAGNLTMLSTRSVGVGFEALSRSTIGFENTAVGNHALYSNTNGYANTAVGYNALSSNLSANENTAVGDTALLSNTVGNENTAFGRSSLYSNTSGTQNTAAGSYAMGGNTNGSRNTALGAYALGSNLNGDENTAVGRTALYSNQTGDGNTASGAFAMYFNTTGSGNTVNGHFAMFNNTTGGANTANGENALYSNTNGVNNTAIGVSTLYDNTSGGQNTAVGAYVLGNNTTGGANTGSGYFALGGNTTGSYNVASGLNALTANQTGSGNVAIGENALSATTNVDGLVAVGAGALYRATGSGNTAVGYFSLNANTTGINNTTVGREALTYNDTGIQNTALGYQTLFYNTTGSNNTAVGTGTLANNTNGGNNTAIGSLALFNTTGSGNIAVGVGAGYAITNGTNNIQIGTLGVANETNVIRIGSGQTRTFIAGVSGATAAGGVQVFVNSSGQLGTLTSSARFKENIRGMADASDVLFALRPVAFRYKPELDPQGLPQFGLVAEEVARVDPDLVARDDQGRIYTVRYEAVNAMLLNEFLKEHDRVTEQGAEIGRQRASLQELSRKFDAQSARSVPSANVDEQGVELAAIQGLNQKLEQKETEIAELKQRLDALERVIRKQQ